MAIGPRIRELLGPFERPISEIYRSIFVDFKALRLKIKEWTTPVEINQILEVGCGEGAIIEILTEIFPHSYITGIDITPRIGRMFKGNSNMVSFKKETIKNFTSTNNGRYDLVVIIDVLHHIAPELHREFLCDTQKSLKKEGFLLLKDWRRSKTPIHLFSYFMERYITGDNVYYPTSDELRCLLREIFGENSIVDEATIPPWKNNIAFLVKNDR